jgi:hypothetical protein
MATSHDRGRRRMTNSNVGLQQMRGPLRGKAAVREHVPKKLLDFFDHDMLYERFLFDHVIPRDRESQTRRYFLDRVLLNMGPKKPIGEDENRSEIPCRVLVMLQVMFKPNVVVPEFNNPVLGNAMVGLM